ncbi:MAG TPA: SpvB/TcaC N-terminal domain-containing protein, partial [Candidatus Limnocylindrales bacterium]
MLGHSAHSAHSRMDIRHRLLVLPVVFIVAMSNQPVPIFKALNAVAAGRPDTAKAATLASPVTASPPRYSASTATQAAQEPACDEATLPPPNTVVAQPRQTVHLNHDTANLEVGPDVVSASTTMEAKSLCQPSMALLDQGMTNVTKGPRRGFRMLPSGKFKAHMKITIPYDPLLIPGGQTDQDVYTFYYDEASTTWRALERVAVDGVNGTIVSRTDHFTDFINAVVTVPDHPETFSHNPNSLKDIKAADPGAGVNLIEPPKSNNGGTARLAYPIELPPGRQGMAPQLSIAYDSAGSNGWLGVGWSLGVPTVSIDTRWGVPRYSSAQETETYLLAGEQLAPVAHRGALVARSAEKVFNARVEGSFRRIVRHGNSPQNYWWEVTEKNGTRSFYGGSPETGAQAADSVLADGAGNVFRWALRETRDLKGNAIRYTYAPVSDVGVAGGTVAGRELYPRSINYTLSGGTPGAYTVTFVRNSELPGYVRRPDVVIDGRGGFKMVTAELLSRVDVSFNNALIRRYEMSYVEGAFRKTLLKSITQRGGSGVVFNRHDLSYYDDLRDGAGAYNGFQAPATWATGNDDVTAGLLDHGQATALSGSLNTAVGGHLYVGFNPLTPTKQGSFGGKVGFNNVSSDGVLAMVDLNGDRLPDKVFKQGGAVHFRLNTSGPDGSNDFAGGRRTAPSLPGISDEDSDLFSFGAEAYLVANVFVNQATTFTTTSQYFSDVNADGLPDLVDGGRVLFNHLDANGVPTFTANSADTPVAIDAGSVDTNGIVEDFADLLEQQIDAYPLSDTLRRWEAPFSGRVRITAPVALIQDPRATPAADGVRVAIQHDGTELWSLDINGNDFATKTPSGVDSIVVDKGDHLYFRVQSRFNGASDQVSWNPDISYLDVAPFSDVNNLNAYRYRVSDDFVLAGRREIGVQTPLNGKVRLLGDLHKTAVTTDDVRLLVIKNGGVFHSQSLGWDQVADIPVDLSIPVARNDTIQLRIQVDSPIDARAVQWTPELFYTESPDTSPLVDANGDPLIQLRPPYDLDLYPVNGLTAPQQAWVVPADGNVTVAPRITALPDASGSVVFTVKRRGALVAKRVITISGGVAQNVDFSLPVTAGQELFFDFSVYDPTLAERITSSNVEVDGSAQPSARHSSAAAGLLALPYRGWTYAGYNGNRGRASQPIVESDLERPFTETSTYDPRTATAYPFMPSPQDSSWRGPDDLTFVNAATMSSSRLGRDAIDTPVPGDFAGARAVQRLTSAGQTSVGGGVSFVSGSVSTGSTTSQVDYLDMNGDRFPDIVGRDRVQFTTATGGLENANRVVPGLGTPRDTTADAFNVGVGGNPAAFFSSGRSDVDTDGTNPRRTSNTGSQMVPLGLTLQAGLGAGTSDPQHDLIDVNGDGLPDRVSGGGSSLTVALNLGYGFAPPEPWGAATLNDGGSENGSIGASLGYNGGIYDFAGGVSLSKNKSQTSATLLDVNGDGLLDRVLTDGSGMRVGFNTGNGFAAPVPWGGALSGVCNDDTSIGLSGINWDQTRVCSGNTGLGAGFYFTIGIGPLCLLACYLIINPGADASQNMARDEATLRDIDGDGYIDHLASTSDSSLKVALNRTGRTNLLRSVNRPMGASFSLEYQRDGNTVDQPDSRWVLSRTSVFDGHAGDGVDTRVTTYAYEGGVFDRLEREFFGYAKVTEQHRDPTNGDAVFRSAVSEYRTDGYYTRGLPSRESIQDAAGRKFVETEHSYLLRDVASGAEPADPRSTGSIFPQTVRTDQRYFEGSPTPGSSTFTTRHYDTFGNIDRYTDAGDSGAEDDVSATVQYSTCAATHIVGAAVNIRTVSAAGTELRRREATVDCVTGNLTQVRYFLADGRAAVTDLEYFPDGNLRLITNPPNQAGQRYQLLYEYDPTVSTHVTRVLDSFGLASTSSYDLRFGTVVNSTDANNSTTTNAYDEFGRMVSVIGPYEQGGTAATVRFEYHPEATTPWAITRNLDPFRSATDTIDTVTFIDGIGRALQAKKDATVHTGPDTAAANVMEVSGRVTYDFAGRKSEVRYPITEPLGTPGIFNPNVDSVAPTRMVYDVMDRATSVTLPDGTVTTSSFGFGPDRAGANRFRTTVTDANGKAKRSYQDVQGLITSVEEFLAGQSVWTSYAYNAMKQIVEVRDDRNNRTTVAYDNFGRRTILDSPDTGRIETVYDLADNPIARITANLRPDNKQIAYTYDFTRLVNITYPNSPENNVTYTYGAPGAADGRAGRPVLVTDESGTEERFYGKLGEVVKEIKSIDSDTGPLPEVYTSLYTYDTFGRLQSMVYPDNETLTYQYDSGGLVRAVRGVKGSHAYQYVNRLEYDKFNQRAFVEAGNNVRTRYTYDPLDRRLSNLSAGKSGGQQIQNLSYGYDDIGNVLSITNAIPVPPPSRDGGPTAQTFSYDDLYRVTSANGTYQFAPDKFDRYRLNMSYDTIHNITNKQQAQEIVEPSGTIVPQQKNTYTAGYTYGAKPHAATHIGQRSYTYDANGNQTGWTDDTNGQRRTMVWDEENRLQSLFDNGHEKTYKYDDAGERVIKRGPQGETAYVNQYFTIRNREIGTKHVIVGPTRFVSKLMKQDKPGSGPPGNQPLEKDLYFFHADHLGTSNYVTDTNGEVYQHTEYFPSGETWVDESSNKQRTPYLFSGKELDEETGLYYFGARYYDPRTGAWQSPEPMLESYMDGSQGGGVFSSINLATYTYANHNPVRLIDPDGRQSWDSFWIRAGGVLKMVGGGTEFVLGAGFALVTAETVVGAAAGGLVALHGYDTFQAGFWQAWNGEHTRSVTVQIMIRAGLSEGQAEIADMVLGVGGSMGTMAAKLSAQLPRAGTAGLELGGAHGSLRAFAADNQMFLVGRYRDIVITGG